MRYQITADWPKAGLKAGEIIDTADPNCPAKGLTIPINARCLDAESWEAQLRAYPDQKHLLGGGWQ
jgi:hypothetical protein